MNLPQPTQQPPPQPQIHQAADKKPMIEPPKSNENIKSWQIQVNYPENNPKKSNEIKAKGIIAPKFIYDFDKSDFTRTPFFDYSLIKSTEPCQNLTPVPPLGRARFDLGDKKFNIYKPQSTDYRGPNKMKQVQQQILIYEQRLKQPNQQTTQNQGYLQRLLNKKEQLDKEEMDTRNLLKNVCAKSVEQIAAVFHLTCTQKDQIADSLQEFICEELSDFLSFSNQNSRQRTNYYVPVQNMKNQITNFPKYSQKMILLENIIYSKWWKTTYEKGYGSTNSINNIESSSIIAPGNGNMSLDSYEPNFDETDINVCLKLFRDPSFHDATTRHRYDAEQLAKVTANAKRKALSQNGPWKKPLLDAIKECGFDAPFSTLYDNLTLFLKNVDASTQQNNQMQNAPQQVQQMQPTMMPVFSPQGIGMPNIASPANNVHINPNIQSVNQRNFLSPSNGPSPSNSEMINPSSSAVRRAPSTIPGQISAPPSSRMSKMFVEFLNSEEGEKRTKRIITMNDVIQTLEMKARIGQISKTSRDIITNLKLYLYMQDANNSQKQHQMQQQYH